MAKPQELPWWQRIPLADMNPVQWESLCDHCAKCCLIKLEDETDSTVYYTDVACDLLDGNTCHCQDYANRTARVPECLCLTPENLDVLYWMPPGCAYRLLHEGKSLPPWHHLVSGDEQSIHRLKQSITGRFVPAATVPEDEWEDHVVTWPLKKKL